MSYFMYMLLAMIIAGTAQARVSSAFKKYSKVSNKRGMTGAAVAQQMLHLAGITNVRVERVAGHLTDHYDPRTMTLRLSASVYDSTSVAALGVAAHETGHAIQHDTSYPFLVLRSLMVPMANIGSTLSFPLILIGLFFGGGTNSFLVTLGILFYAVAVLFTLITLPVEFDASSRAISMLQSYHFLDDDEIGGAKRVLSAAAMTYVASAAVAILELLRLLAIFGNRDD